MIKARVSPSGQITIPQRIRRFLSLKKGDRIIFTEMPDGTVMMRKDDEIPEDEEKSPGKNEKDSNSHDDEIPYWYFV